MHCALIVSYWRLLERNAYETWRPTSGGRSFTHAAPLLLWNKLLAVFREIESLDVFKGNLKAHLLIVHF